MYKLNIVCRNSDGIDDYEFSHWGAFAGDHMSKGFKKETVECANECNKDDKCVAFNHRLDGDKSCFIYHAIGELIRDISAGVGESKAFRRCSSVYLWFISPHFEYIKINLN